MFVSADHTQVCWFKHDFKHLYINEKNCAKRHMLHLFLAHNDKQSGTCRFKATSETQWRNEITPGGVTTSRERVWKKSTTQKTGNTNVVSILGMRAELIFSLPVCCHVLMSRQAGPSCANNVGKCCPLALAGDGNMAFSHIGPGLQTRYKIALVNEIRIAGWWGKEDMRRGWVWVKSSPGGREEKQSVTRSNEEGPHLQIRQEHQSKWALILLRHGLRAQAELFLIIAQRDTYQ